MNDPTDVRNGYALAGDTSSYTINVDAHGLPVFGGGGTPVTVPAKPAVGGITNGFFAGRVYAPSATLARGD